MMNKGNEGVNTLVRVLVMILFLLAIGGLIYLLKDEIYKQLSNLASVMKLR